MNFKHLISSGFCAVLLLLGGNVLAQDEAAFNNGKTVFRNYCGSCHAKNMKSDLTGPALGGVQERWAEYPQEDLYAWIRNSSAMIEAGHPRAVQLWNTWKPTRMTAFPALTDEEIANTLVYIDLMYTQGGLNKDGASVAVTDDIAEEEDNTLLFVTLIVILALLAVVLARIVSNLSYMAAVNEGRDPGPRRTLVEMLTSKGVIAFAIFALIVLAGYTTVDRAIELGRQQGYQPEQPIWFSHEIHGGQQKIECQYCHDGARRSKHSVIPAANTCMNCHSAVKKGRISGTSEITKIYASIGYDPSEGKYIENYDRMTLDEQEAIFKKWISDEYIKDNDGQMDDEGESVIQGQWDNIVASLTDPENNDNEVAGPINWVRIHNLPDHAYFNHAQHVSVGKVECQTCHGPIEQMEVVYQYSPLSMGWCINCHRQTEVQFTNNDYYKVYTRYQEELESGEREKVTVEDIGGLECQKCHY